MADNGAETEAESVRSMSALVGMKERPSVSRSRIDILASILENSSGGSQRAGVAAAHELCCSRLNAYRNLLVQGGFLAIKPGEGQGIFEITGRGEGFLRDYFRIREILETNEKKQ